MAGGGVLHAGLAHGQLLAELGDLALQPVGLAGERGALGDQAVEEGRGVAELVFEVGDLPAQGRQLALPLQHAGGRHLAFDVEGAGLHPDAVAGEEGEAGMEPGQPLGVGVAAHQEGGGEGGGEVFGEAQGLAQGEDHGRIVHHRPGFRRAGLALDERLESHDREMSRLRAEVESGRAQIAAWRQEADKLTGRRGDLESALARAQDELQAALEHKAAAEEGVLEEQERLDLHRQEIRLLEENIAGHRERRDAVRGEIEELRVQQASLKQDAEHLALTFRDDFQAPLPEVPGEPRADLAELEGELARTKAALERLGPVNILAVQEHDEQEQRYEFLTTQRADVAASVESLKRTIREINEASGERFNTTRFVDLLSEMAEGTQFIVITHNKLTMEVASRLYGVTMEEKGVSKLVSVELEEVQPERRLATASGG